MRGDWLRGFVATGLVTIIAASDPLQTQVQAGPRLMLESTAGRDPFEFSLASCHRKTGKGDGPTAAALKARPADLAMLARRNRRAFPKDRVLAIVTGTGRPVAAHGSSDMPVCGQISRRLDPSEPRVTQRSDNVVANVEVLQEPSTAPGELGARLFRTHCASCHGPHGRGDGPLAEQLRRVPPDLTDYTARNGGVFPSERLYRIIDGRDVSSHGNRDMPVWGDAFSRSRDALTDEEVRTRIEAIVRYLQGIQRRVA